MAEHRIERIYIERRDVHPLEPLRRERPLEGQRKVIAVPGARAEQDPDGLDLEAAEREAEDSRRRRIQPLDVVNGYDERAAACKPDQDGPYGHPERLLRHEGFGLVGLE